jgi:hypothetical protein
LGLGATAPELNPSNTQEPKLVHIELNIAKRRGNADTIELQSAPLRCCNGAEFQSASIKLKQTNGAEELSAEGNCAIAERRTVARRESVQKLPVKQSLIIPSLNMETAALEAGSES